MAKNQFSLGSSSSYESVLKQATTEKTSMLSLSKVYPAYITLLITLAVSIGLWQLVDSQVENDINTSFDKAISSIMNRFDSEYQKNDQVLTSVSGLYKTLVQVVRDYFDLYATIPTNTNKSLLGVIYAPRVAESDLESYYYNIRSQGLWTYVVIPDGVRDFYYPVQFIVPDKPNTHMSGFDYGTVPTIKKAITEAMEMNKTVSTPIFKFRKDTLGFFLMTPVYKKGAPIDSKPNRIKYYDGCVMLEINSKLFFEKSLGSGNQSDTSVVFQCYNAASNGKGEVVFNSSNAGLLKTGYEPDLYQERILKIADKEFIVKFSTIPDFGGSFQKFAPILTLIVSLLLSGLAFAFMLNIINRKQSALSLAERMTRSQRRIVESSNDIIAVLDLEGTWKSMNPASNKILQYQPDELVNQKIDRLFASKHEQDEFYDIINEPSENLTKIIDTKMLNKNGESKWISWSLSVSRIEGMIYTTGRDVTLEKIHEEQENIRNKQVMLAEQLSREASEYKSSFIAKLSLQLRNSLTGILGYLDLVSYKAYENDEEHDSYINEASKSSKEILNFVTTSTGSLEVTDSIEESIKVMTAIKISKPFKDAIEQFNKELNNQHHFKINLDNSLENNIAVVDAKHLSNSIVSLLDVMIQDVDEGEIKVSSKLVDGQDLTQIIISTPTVELLTGMIKVFNDNQSNLIDALKIDQADIVLKLALCASKFRMIHGTLTVKTHGAKGNEVIINLQNKIQQEEAA